MRDDDDREEITFDELMERLEKIIEAAVARAIVRAVDEINRRAVRVPSAFFANGGDA